jgi:D-alanyl-D-alanine carboxypeptidase/D-alanyl-D-alanine-endopeptidase (penicillin-binding protein 4)
MLTFLVVSCGSQPSEENNQPKHERADQFLSNPALAGASVGVLITNLQSGEVISAYNPYKTLIPASIQKLLIAGATLEIIGPEHTFKTGLAYSGNIDQNGILHGDLIIIGGGDPALGSKRFSDHYGDVVERFSAAVSKAGVTKIEGNIIGDASIFGPPQIPDTWIWEDIGNYYGSPAFGLNIFENTYHLTFSSGKPGELTKIISQEPELPGIEFRNFVSAANNNRDNAYIFGSYLAPVREVRGTIPANRNSFSIKGSIPNPPLQFAAMLTDNLSKKGILVNHAPDVIWSEKDGRKSTTILETESPPLTEIVKELNMKSVNLYAEALLLHLVKKEGKKVSVDDGCEVLSAFWASKGMDTKGLFPEDASGLSRANGITPRQMAFLLDYMKNKSPVSEPFLASLPVSGKSGSLASSFEEIEGKFSAKSGYMSRVLNYAGYLETAGGKDLIVVLMVNNYTCSTAEMKKIWESYIQEIYLNY